MSSDSFLGAETIGPVKYNLQKYAWAMDPIEGMDNSYTMTSADGLRERVFVDPTDAIRMIRAWMRSQQNHFRMPREYPASRLVSNSPRPLIVNGPTKVSSTLLYMTFESLALTRAY